jgi:hypothetical protein
MKEGEDQAEFGGGTVHSSVVTGKETTGWHCRDRGAACLQQYCHRDSTTVPAGRELAASKQEGEDQIKFTILLPAGGLSP